MYAPVASLWAGNPDYGLYVAVPLLSYFEQRQLGFVHCRVPQDRASGHPLADVRPVPHEAERAIFICSEGKHSPLTSFFS